MTMIMTMLKENYPQAHFADDFNWHFSYPGGLVGELSILYADTNEYVAFYGSPLRVHGYSGTWNIDIYDYMFSGYQANYYIGELSAQKYFASTNPDRFVMQLPKGMHKFVNLGGDYRIPVEGKRNEYIDINNDGSWMLEYGHGNVLSTFYQAVIHPTLFYSLDVGSLVTAIADSSYLMVKNAMKV